MIRLMLVLLSAALLGLVTIGCGEDPAPAPPPPTDEAPPEPGPPPEEPGS